MFGFSWARIDVSIYQDIFDMYSIYAGTALAAMAAAQYPFAGGELTYSVVDCSGDTLDLYTSCRRGNGVPSCITAEGSVTVFFFSPSIGRPNVVSESTDFTAEA